MPKPKITGKPKSVKAYMIVTPKGNPYTINWFQYQAWADAVDDFVVGQFFDCFAQYKRRMIRQGYRCIRVSIVPL